MKRLFFIILVFCATATIAQKSKVLKEYENRISANINAAISNNYYSCKQFFDNAYDMYPQIPRGILEAVSYTMTRFYHIDSTGEESCMGLPRVYGVMGLTLNGKNYFRNNLIKVSVLSNISINDIIDSPEKNINAFAAAYVAIKNQLEITSMRVEDQMPVLIELSELPLTSDIQNDFAMNSHLYSVFSFLNNKDYSVLCGFPEYTIDLKNVFGENNYSILSSGHVTITDSTVTNSSGQKFINNHLHSSLSPNSSDYGPAIWNAAASCNYTVGRGGTAISAVVIHDTEGSYAGSISWFQNCSAVVSAHYVLRSSDGQITQMVLEADKAWHVGSENGYTIGIEHEGYEAQTGWYTTAMYTTSSALVRDICNSGYGISPLRTGFWPWLATTYYSSSSIPGSCTEIKGHQHYPNQTHTDPGPNWDWNYYYKLVNNSPTISTLTTATGNFYDTGGSSANYSNDERDVWVISPTGATSVTLNFSSFSVENTWDYMYIYDGNSIWSPLIGYYTGTTSPGTITSTSGALTVEFRSDCATNDVGWVANWTSTQASTSPTNLTAGTPSCPDNSVVFSWQNSGTGWYIQISNSATFTNPYIKWVTGLTTYTGPAGFVLQSDGTTPLVFNNSTTYYWRIWDVTAFTNGTSFTTLNCDITAPTTSVSTPGTWKTADFTATFTDADNDSVEKAFYNVLDYDGTYWGANAQNGFFNDDFNSLNSSVWTIPASSGTWQVTGGELVQTDTLVSNTNIYAALNQNLSNRYLYHFIAKVEGAGSNRRFGFHLFCDDASQTNRGNSYFVWFRVEGHTMEFFKVVSNTFTTASSIVSNVITTPGQYYDFKITYDRILGKISVWRDNIFMGSWTDPSPYSTNGNYISFRSGNSKLTVSNLEVFRSRNPTATITLNGSIKDIRYQNPNPSTSAAKIQSIVVDENNNLSTIANQALNIDWTPPSDVVVNDGTTIDIDTVYSTTTASAVWTTSTDPNSDIAEYWYALGSTIGGTDITVWTNNGTSTSITLSGLSLTIGNHYYFSVKTKNNAGLWSNVISSDGFIVSSLNFPVADFYVYNDTLYLPTPNALFFNTSVNATTYSWDFGDGGTSTAVNPWHTYTAAGVYNVKLIAASTGFPNDTMIKNNYVHVLDPTSVSAILANEIRVMPNPFKNNLRIEFGQSLSGIIQINDALGNTVCNNNLNAANYFEWNTDQMKLNSGMYFIVIHDNAGKTYKVAVAKIE